MKNTFHLVRYFCRVYLLSSLYSRGICHYTSYIICILHITCSVYYILYHIKYSQEHEIKDSVRDTPSPHFRDLDNYISIKVSKNSRGIRCFMLLSIRYLWQASVLRTLLHGSQVSFPSLHFE